MNANNTSLFTVLRKFFSKMVNKVKWLHDAGYAHRDLKVGRVYLSTVVCPSPLAIYHGSVLPITTVTVGRRS